MVPGTRAASQRHLQRLPLAAEAEAAAFPEERQHDAENYASGRRQGVLGLLPAQGFDILKI